MTTEDPRQDALRRAERRGAARGLLNWQRRRATRRRTQMFDLWSGRALVLVVLVYLITAAAIGLVPALVVTGMLAFVAVIGRAFITSTELIIAVVSWLVTMAVVVYLLLPTALSMGHYMEPVHIAAYLLPIAAAFGPWMLRRHLGNRGITVVIGHVGCLLAAAMMLWSVSLGSLLGMIWVIGVLIVRGGGLVSLRLLGARFRSRIVVNRAARHERNPQVHQDVSDAHLSAEGVQIGAQAELQTAAQLLELDSEWTVLHSRELPGTNADADHIAIGLPGVFLIDSKDWKGEISTQLVSPPDGGEPFEAYVLDGRMDRLMERITPIAFEARRLAYGLSMSPQDVQIIVCFTKRMKMPKPVLEVEFRDVWDEHDQVVWDPKVTMVSVDSIVGHLLAQPPLVWRHRSRLSRLLDRWRSRDVAVVDQEKNRRYVRDLGLLADYVFPPKM